MGPAPHALREPQLCTYECVLPLLDPTALRAARNCLARWATAGPGNARCWRILCLGSLQAVHVTLRFPSSDASTLEPLSRELEAVAG
jgi:hypothetical protein